MQRPVALVALVALSWSQLVTLRCDMGTGLAEGVAGSAPAHHMATMQHPATATAHQRTPHQLPRAQHGQDHGGDHGCQMIMACNYASIRQGRATVLTRFPAVFLRAAFVANPIPVAAELAVETPPPRLAV